MVENTLILRGTENDGYVHKYYFNKTGKFILWFFDFMKELGFNEEEYIHEFEEDVEKITQTLRTFRNEEFDVEVVYFEDELVFIVRTKSREKLIDLSNKYMKFKEEQDGGKKE